MCCPLQAAGGRVKTLEVLIFIFILGFLCFNWPLLEIFRSNVVSYLAVSWLLFIISVALIDFKIKRSKHS